MPSVSRFLGYSIAFAFQDHNPPHFHVLKGSERVASVDIQELDFIGETSLNKRERRSILGWAAIYQEELLENWELSLKDVPVKLKQITPLSKVVNL